MFQRLLSLAILVALTLVWPTTTVVADPLLGDQKPPQSITYFTSVEGIHEYRLDNGLRILLFPDPSKQTTTVNITYLVGSRHEGYGETGMTHLLEHLLFKGSTDHPNIPDELTSHGARPNGTTWVDRTNYFETFAATDENLEWALDLEADRMVNAFVSREDLDSEMSVVRNEFEIGENNPRGVLEERVYSTAFIWHNYGNTPIGARSDIENVPIDRLKAFYQKWYRPDNAVLVVAGQFDPQRTLELIDMKFGPLSPPEAPVEVVYTSEPAQDGERAVTLRRVGDVQVIMAGYHVPSGAHPDYPALVVLSRILGDTPSGRLHKALVETRMATEVAGQADRFRDASMFLVTAELPKEQSLDAAKTEFLNVTEGLLADPPTEEEVARAKTALLRRWETTLRNTSWAAINLSEWSAMGDWRLMFLYRDRLQEVTPEDVTRVATAYLQQTNRTLGVYEPTDEATRVEVPVTPDVAAMVATYAGGDGLVLGEEFDVSPDNIEAHVERSELSNGFKLVMLPKKTRGETVNLSLFLGLGSEKTLRGKAEIGELTGDMLMRGTTTRTRQAIRDEIDGIQAQFRVFAGATSVNASIQVNRSHLNDVLRLLADVLRNPSFDASEFDQLKQQTLVSTEESKTNPRSRVSTALGRHLEPRPADHVEYTPTAEERIDRLNTVGLDDLRKFHADFYGASSGEVAVVGDFDPGQVESLMAEILGDWESKTPYQRIADTYEDVPALVERIEIPDKESATMGARLAIQMRDTDDDYPGLNLGNYMVGGGFLNSRLAGRIRGTDGLSYGVGSWFGAHPIDDDASWGAYAMYAPQNDARLLQAFDEEIRKVLADGFTEVEVTDAKSGWLQRRMVSRSNDRELARTLQSRERYDRTMEWDKSLETRVSALSPEDILKAWRLHVDVSKISMVRAGDFSRAEAEEHQAAVDSDRSVTP